MAPNPRVTREQVQAMTTAELAAGLMSSEYAFDVERLMEREALARLLRALPVALNDRNA